MAIKKGASGWEDLSETPKRLTRGIFLDIMAPEGMGKTSLALTLARMGSVGYVDLDQSIDRAKRPDGKKSTSRIKTLPIRYSGGLTQEMNKTEAKDAWVELERKVGEAVVDWADGIILDTGTEAWELLRLAEFGTTTPRGRTDKLYGPVNAKFRQLLRNIYRGHKKHLVTVHQMKEEYIDKAQPDGTIGSMKTGKMKAACMKEVPYLADMAVRCYRTKGDFKAVIEMCKLDPSLEGIELEDEQLDIAAIIGLATGTDTEDWVKK